MTISVMSGNKLEFRVFKGEMVAGEIITPKVDVYFNGELVATVLSGLTDFHDENPDFDATKTCPTLHVEALFHTVLVTNEWLNS